MFNSEHRKSSSRAILSGVFRLHRQDVPAGQGSPTIEAAHAGAPVLLRQDRILDQFGFKETAWRP
jgi:hypothetical protein